MTINYCGGNSASELCFFFGSFIPTSQTSFTLSFTLTTTGEITTGKVTRRPYLAVMVPKPPLNFRKKSENCGPKDM